MPSSSIVHAALFTAGAVIGAGAATFAHAQRREVKQTTPYGIPPALSQGGRSNAQEMARLPVIEITATGTPGIAQLKSISSDVLKYGNPG